MDMYKGADKTIDPQLKKYIQDINNKFDQEITQAKVERIVKTIVESMKHRLKAVNDLSDQQNNLMQKDIYSFPLYLKEIGSPSFSRWFILNQVVQEHHPAQLSLHSMTTDDVVFQMLTTNYNKTFLKLSEKEAKILSQHQNKFKRYKAQCATATQIFLLLTKDTYKAAIEHILYFRQELTETLVGGQQANAVMRLPSDSNRVFLLYSLTQINKCLVEGEIDQAIDWANMVTIDSCMLLEP